MSPEPPARHLARPSPQLNATQLVTLACVRMYAILAGFFDIGVKPEVEYSLSPFILELRMEARGVTMIPVCRHLITRLLPHLSEICNLVSHELHSIWRGISHVAIAIKSLGGCQAFQVPATRLVRVAKGRVIVQPERLVFITGATTQVRGRLVSISGKVPFIYILSVQLYMK